MDIDMHIAGRRVRIDGTTVTVDDATYTLGPGDELDVADATIACADDGAIHVRTAPPAAGGSTTLNQISGGNTGTVNQFGNVDNITFG